MASDLSRPPFVHCWSSRILQAYCSKSADSHDRNHVRMTFDSSLRQRLPRQPSKSRRRIDSCLVKGLKRLREIELRLRGHRLIGQQTLAFLGLRGSKVASHYS